MMGGKRLLLRHDFWAPSAPDLDYIPATFALHPNAIDAPAVRTVLVP